MDRIRDKLQGESKAGGSDALHRHLQELRSKVPNDRMMAARKIRLYAQEEARERREQGFQKVLNVFLNHIQTWGSSSDISDRRACLLLMDELIDVAMDQNSEDVVIRFANQLTQIINHFGASTSSCSPADIEMLRLITSTLGHLTRAASPVLTAHYVELQLKQVKDWLKKDQYESRRYAAVFVVMELSRNTPTLFSVHLSSFFEYIWTALSDPKIQIRTSAAIALRNCLRLISQRTSRQMLKYLDIIYRQARKEFPASGVSWVDHKEKLKEMNKSKHLRPGKPFGNRTVKDVASEVAGIHGALLTFYELLDESTGSFMGMYFHEVLNDCVLRKEIKGHKNQDIREAVVAILPRLASFCPTEMMADFLDTCTKHMIETIQSATPSNKQLPLSGRAVAFRALGQLCGIPQVSESIRPHLPKIIGLIKDALTPKPKYPFCQEALLCLGALVSSIGIPRDLEAQISVLILSMFNGGLTPLLVSTLGCIGKLGPNHMPKIRHRLLDELATVLGMMDKGSSSKQANYLTSTTSSSSDIDLENEMVWGASTGQFGRDNRSYSAEVLGRFRSTSKSSGDYKLKGSPNGSRLQRITAKTSLWFHSHVPQVTHNQAVLTHTHERPNTGQIESSIQRLALRTLGTFDFGEISLFPLLLQSVVRFLESTNPVIRREAAMACSRLLVREIKSSQQLDGLEELDDLGKLRKIQKDAHEKVKSQSPSNITIDVGASSDDATSSSARKIEIDHIIERLVLVAMTDEEPEIRCCVISELDSNFSKYLIQNPDNLRSMFILINDQSFEVRAAAMKCLGRLAGLAPAYVMPPLRSTLMRLLSELGFGVDTRQDEEAVTLLALLVRGLDPVLARPHIKSMLERLLLRLKDNNPRVTTAVMSALGEIAQVAGESLTPYVGEILSIAMVSLEDHSADSFSKREIALSTIAKVSSNTVMSIWPYFLHRRLLDQVLNVLTTSSSPWKLRRQAMVTLGVVGALDPWLHKMNCKALQRGDSGLFLNQSGPSRLDMLDLHHAKYFGNDDAFESDSDDGVDEGEYTVGLNQDRQAEGHAWVLSDLDAVAPKNVFSVDPMWGEAVGDSVVGSKYHKRVSLYGGKLGGDALDVDGAPGRPRRNRRSSVRGLVEKASFRNMSRRSTVVSNTHAANFVTGLLTSAKGQEGQPGAAQEQPQPQVPKAPGFHKTAHPSDPASAGHLRNTVPQATAKALNVTEEQVALFGGLALNSDGLPNASSILPSMIQDPGDYYATVTIVALVAVLGDASLSGHHTKVIEAILIIFKSMETRCVRFLLVVVPRLLQVVVAGAQGAPEAGALYFQYLERLVGIVKEHIQPFLPAIAAAVKPFWETELLPGVLSLALIIAEKIGAEELRAHVAGFLPDLLNVLQVERDNVRYEHTLVVLRVLASMGPALSDSMYLVLPKLMKLIDRSVTVFSAVPFQLREQAVRCLNLLIKRCQIADHASRILHPLVRTLQDCRMEKYDERDQRLLFELVMETLMALIYRLEEEFSPWVLAVNKALRTHLDSYSSTSGLPSNPFSSHGPSTRDLELVENYYSLVQRVLRGQPLPKPSWFRANVEKAAFGLHKDIEPETDLAEKSLVSPGRPAKGGKKHDGNENDLREVDTTVLKKVWDTTQRSTENDWIEWFRKLCLAVIAQSPWPSVRACLALAQIHEPFAKQLFNCAFVSCWKELDHEYREHLVNSLEVAVQSVNMPADMLQQLLNLAEFMEHDDNPLPIDIRTLSRLALRCHAFTKALHYKELEFRMSPHTCIADLISINNNLEHPEAAFGVVAFAQIHHPTSIEVQPSWYERLGQWQEALNAYEAKAAPRQVKGLSRVASDGRGAGPAWNPKGHVSRRSNSNNELDGVSESLHPVSDEVISVTLGRLRCQRALCEWNSMAALGEQKWTEILDIEASRQAHVHHQRRQSRSSTASSISRGKTDNEGGEDNDGEGNTLSTARSDLSSTWVPGGAPIPPKVAVDVRSQVSGNLSPFLLAPQPVPGGDVGGQSSSLTLDIGLLDVAGGMGRDEAFAAPLTLTGLQAAAELGVDQPAGGALSNRSDILHQYAQKVATLSAYASWSLGKWTDMIRFTNITMPSALDGNFLRAILALHRNKFDEAQVHVERTYRVLDSALSASITESYTRAYNRLVIVQQLAEIEEIVTFKRMVANGQHREAADYFQRMRRLWCQRLQGVQQSVEVLLPLLAVRSMVVPPHHDLDTWLNFVKVCRRKGRHTLAIKALLNLGVGAPTDPEGVTSLVGEDRGHRFHIRSAARKLSTTSVRSKMTLEGSANLPNQLASHSTGSLIPRCALPADHQPHPRVAFAYLKHLWAIGAHQEALDRLELLTQKLVASLQREGALVGRKPKGRSTSRRRRRGTRATQESTDSNSDTLDVDDSALTSGTGDLTSAVPGDPIGQVSWEQRKRLAVRCHCKLGEWRLAISDLRLDTAGEGQGSSVPGTLAQVLGYYKRAIEIDAGSYKAWHALALTSFQAYESQQPVVAEGSKTPKPRGRKHSKSQGRGRSASRKGRKAKKTSGSKRLKFVIQAINAFNRSIALGRRDGVNVLQDILRLLTLWFSHTEDHEVLEAIRQGLSTVGVETWLDVIPQLIARVHKPGDLVCELLNRIGREHPQVLIYPLTVAAKSDNFDRAQAASQVLSTMREIYPTLVDEAEMVSRELIRVAVLWHEMWMEGLEDASRRYFTANRDIQGMIDILTPLHQVMERGPQTLQEVGFLQSFGRELNEAYEWVKVYQRSKNPSYLSQAWDLYYQVFKTVNTMQKAKSLELRHVSPQLLKAKNLQLAVPGTYQVGQEVTSIQEFWPTLKVITSKQRPRVLSLTGSDGAKYMFLLKGHEDLRLDERVMQLFGLVNTLLASDAETNRQNLEIQRYTVIPLSNKAGFIEWVPNTDTFHSLIREYRVSRGVLTNVEEHLIHQMTSNYQELQVMQKLEVFEHALSETSGQDLAQVIWLKSPNSEVWLDRRTNFTRSLAAMSMVGYILGLGDRHLSNLMLERSSGRVLHIDFGDCFEVTMHREQHPEKIPFRLTRMLVNAMEASGIEGNFRFTCESVMSVLRQNRESVMTMLEAFVYDPLITWRLLQKNVPSGDGEGSEDIELRMKNGIDDVQSNGGQSGQSDGVEYDASATKLDVITQSLAHGGQKGAPGSGAVPVNVTLNQRAVEVIERVRAKLRGADFQDSSDQPSDTLDVPEQVKRLIDQATSHQNLCQCYLGWSPFW